MAIFTSIKKYFKTILVILTILSLVSTIFSVWYGVYQSREKERYKNNYSIATSQSRQYKDKNGLLITEVANLTLTVDDLRNSSDTTIKKLVKELDNSYLKTRKLQGMLEVQSQSNYNFNTHPEDSYLSIITDSVVIDSVKIQVAKYHDSWIDFSYTKKEGADSANVKIITYGDLIVFNTWAKDGKWKIRNIWKWRKRKNHTIVKSLSPYDSIRSIKAIDVVK